MAVRRRGSTLAAAGQGVRVSTVMVAIAAAAAGAGGYAAGGGFWPSLAAAACAGVAAAAGGAATAPAAAPAPKPATPIPAPALDAGLPPGLGRDLLDRLPLGLIVIDDAGRVAYENPAAADVIGRRCLGLAGAAALRAPALAEALAAALVGRVETEVDATLQRGQERVVRAYVRPLPRPDGASPAGAAPLPSVLVLFEDRTRAAKAEALRRDFVANASHELRTPLASIAGFIETLQGHARGDAAATEQFLRIMATQADRMRRLIDDLLSLNRIETDEHVRPRDVVDVADTVREVASALAPVAAAHGTVVEIDLPDAGLLVRGDADELAQVFVNLIDNAVKYAGDHGPVRVETEPPTPARPGMLGVTVADRGPGIAREHLPRLTERFYRVSVSRSRERGGTGLGLAIAKHILNRHRGELSIASVVGRGSRFTVWLPARAVGEHGDVDGRAATVAAGRGAA
jgi:two-component system phosphate regulon sensor histidine kinase PhoR